MRPSSVATAALLVVLVTTAIPAGAANAQYEFTESVYEGTQGDVVEITVDVPDTVTGTFDVHVGSEKANFLVHATVTDSDDDGEVTVELDTATAGQVSPDEAITVAGDDSVESVTRDTDRLSSRLDAGEYQLRVGSFDDPADTSSLQLLSAAPPNETVTSSPTTPAVELGFADSIVVADAGSDGVATIPVQFGADTDVVTVTVASDDTGLDASADVVDADGDGHANVTIDAATTATSPQQYLSVSDGDRLRNVSRSGSATTVVAGTEYDLSLTVDGTVVDIGTLVVAEDLTETTAVTTKTTAATDETPTHQPTTTTTPAPTTTSELPGFGALLAGIALVVAGFVAGRD
ncbi:PGF-CTERM sorting domain-containing protein [Haloferax sp. YSSS75]|uniref:DUF7827 domain-containing protein n=1 Tax=Haloferax sp. YSSS75 TaxID=3388564 RepID=UPI00398CBE43